MTAEFPPRWTPSPHPEVDLLYFAKFEERTRVALDDGALAPESEGSRSGLTLGPGLPWSFLKALWRMEEAESGPRCVLCDRLQLLYRFRRGGHRPPGLLGATRRCAACAVLYEGLWDRDGLAQRLDRAKAQARPTGVHAAPVAVAAPTAVGDGPMRVDPDSEARAAEVILKAHDAPRWTRHRPQCPGDYVVATLDGRKRAHRRVFRDPRTLRFREEAPEPWDGWWWSRPGAEVLLDFPRRP